MRPLVWFRSDLRVRDNHALHHACERATDGVVAVYVISADQWREEHDIGAPKVDFLLRCVRELSVSLGKLNIPLRVLDVPRFDGVPDALLALARTCDCSAIFFNNEYEWNERERDAAVADVFQRAGKGVHGFTDQVVFTPGDVLTKSDTWYTVYSPFKKRWRERYKDDDAPSCLPTPKRQRQLDIEADNVPETIDGFDFGAENVRPDLWKAGEDHALSRLDAFVGSRIDEYKSKRDIPSVNGTSTLSPYLHAGVVSPRQCLEAALEANNGRIDTGSAGIVGWIEELIWREFYKHVLVGFSHVSRGQPFKKKLDRVNWSYSKKNFAAWQEGRTGYPIVDAAMRQLAQTGWMHNRLRMIVAMFLTKDLMIDWRWGERHFMQQLVDGDLASNNGGWQWSASTGTDAQPYFRIFNPTTQGEKFDKDGTFIKKFVPELGSLSGKALHSPSRAGLFEKLDYPEPIVDHKAAREKTLAAFKEAAGSG
ncbi:MAG: deoxyribodipyrimidine photo-lyase [Planctomycetota bacterium]